MNRKLQDLREMLCEELDKVARKKDIDPNDLNNIDKLTHSIKNIDKIMLANEMIDEYGYDISYARAGRDGDGDGKYSERRGRDARGRYTSRDSYPSDGGHSTRNYNYDYSNRGYSGHYEQRIIDQMKDIIEDAEKHM